MSAPRQLFAEELPVGETIPVGRRRVSEQEIIDFATAWDPQPFHVDREFAATTRFGEVIGSGLHSLGILQRMAVERAYSHWAIIAGRRIREVEFLSPLRAGAEVAGWVRIEEREHLDERRSRILKRGGLDVVGGEPIICASLRRLRTPSAALTSSTADGSALILISLS